MFDARGPLAMTVHCRGQSRAVCGHNLCPHGQRVLLPRGHHGLAPRYSHGGFQTRSTPRSVLTPSLRDTPSIEYWPGESVHPWWIYRGPQEANYQHQEDGKARWMGNVFIEKLWKSVEYEESISRHMTQLPWHERNWEIALTATTRGGAIKGLATRPWPGLHWTTLHGMKRAVWNAMAHNLKYPLHGLG
jgi:hypothetical protein